MPNPPELIAHRGASRERPENTLAAFERAATLGATAIELDVHLSRDGHLIVHHDPIVTSGAAPAAIRSMTLADVRAYQVGGEPIPTLNDVVTRVGSHLRIYCELKGPGTAGPSVMLLEPLGDGAAVHSFDHRMIADARKLAPALARGVLESSYHVDPAFPLAAVEARDLWQYESLIDAALVNAVHSARGRVIAWTVNAPARAAELAAMGVDGICTDDVAAVAAAVAR